MVVIVFTWLMFNTGKAKENELRVKQVESENNILRKALDELKQDIGNSDQSNGMQCLFTTIITTVLISYN